MRAKEIDLQGCCLVEVKQICAPQREILQAVRGQRGENYHQDRGILVNDVVK